MQKQGKVTFVGAGPGDPDLLTVKARKVLDAADVILYDSLVGADILENVPFQTLLIPCGKNVLTGEGRQARTNALLVEHAAAGRHVVRLKGGDPAIFGRLGEEIACLRRAGIRYEIVPGVNAVLAAAAAAGIPLTDRDLAPGLSLVSGHPAADKDDPGVDWQALAASGHTIAVFMGVGRLQQTAANLLQWLPEDTPVAVIEQASLPQEHVTVGPLATFAREPLFFATPALILVGPIVSLVEAWPGRETLTSGGGELKFNVFSC